MNNIVLTAPTVEPITPAEAKAQLNIDSAFTDDDTFIDTCIKSARVWLEGRTGQSFLKQERVQYLDKFPLCDGIEILHGPVLLAGSGVVAPVVKYYDSSDTEQTWADTNYWLDTRSYTPKIVAKYSWPSVGLRPSPISVTFWAGFGEAATAVPETIKTCMKLLVSHAYNNRTPEFETNRGEWIKLEHGIERILSFDVRFQTYAARY